ncbi:MAG: AtpZ/AtpI family protein [Clostridia bacterium]
MKEILLVANLGFSIIIPLVGSIYASLWIKNHFDLPDYIVILGIFFGLFCGLYSFVKIALNLKGKGKK